MRSVFLKIKFEYFITKSIKFKIERIIIPLSL